MDTKTQQLENGKIYRVVSNRKGTFTGKLLKHSSIFADFEITEGKADAILDYNVCGVGDKVGVRIEWCTFTEVTT